MDKKKIERINALSKKARSEGLTEEEKKEREDLRREYIESFRLSLKSQLDSTYIQKEDGSLEKLKMKEDTGYKS